MSGKASGKQRVRCFLRCRLAAAAASCRRIAARQIERSTAPRVGPRDDSKSTTETKCPCSVRAERSQRHRRHVACKYVCVWGGVGAKKAGKAHLDGPEGVRVDEAVPRRALDLIDNRAHLPATTLPAFLEECNPDASDDNDHDDNLEKNATQMAATIMIMMTILRRMQPRWQRDRGGAP